MFNISKNNINEVLFFKMHKFLFCFSNLSGDQQANNAFYNCIDSAPDIPDAKAVPLGLDMVNTMIKFFI